MKRLILLFPIFLIASTGFSQTPGIRWQRTTGSVSSDNYFFTLKSIDNGIISIDNRQDGYLNMCVEKFTADGVLQWQKFVGAGLGVSVYRAVSYQYNSDGSIVILSGGPGGGFYTSTMYLVKIDKEGNLLWEKFFAGEKETMPSRIIKSINGGYLVTGISNSNTGIGAGNHGGTSGSVDACLVKINEAGDIIWKKMLGGIATEGNNRINFDKGRLIETSDGSIYLLNETYSNDGDVSGNHGGQDLWLVKLNSNGDIQWSKTLGGIYDEYSADFKLLPSGEIWVLGWSASPELTINGMNQGDFYVARVSPTGDLLFQKCYGSTGADEPTQIVSVDNDGSCVLLGQVSRGDGNVQNFHGTADIWMLKIDLAGNIIWQNSIGGPGDDRLTEDGDPTKYVSGGSIQTSEGGYLISGVTQSTDGGDVTGSHGGRDIFMVKLSAAGSTEWTRCLGGNNHDFTRGLPVELGPNEYAIGGLTTSSNGDIQRYYGNGDAWVVKLGPINRIKGAIFIDQNGNGTKDADESFFSDVRISVSKGNDSLIAVPYNGKFYMSTDTGTFVTRITPDHPYYTISPSQFTSTFSTFFNTDSFTIALQPIPGIKDLSISVNPLTVSRPGFNVKYSISYKNNGVVSIPTGEILFKKDPRLTLLSSVPAISSSDGDILKWSYTNLGPGGSGDITINMRVLAPPAVSITDTLSSVAIITPVAGDITPLDDSATIRQKVQGSYDPNDKTENFAGKITQGQVSSGEYINYLVRFQNTGTDTAFNITIRDTLDTKLDWSSVEMVAASHMYQFSIDSSNQLQWVFNDIMLLDSNANEPASHGFIAYRVKPKANLVAGNEIINSASIYFDFNLPVLTNQARTLVQNNPVVLPLRLLDFNATYQKPTAVLKWSTSDEVNVERFEIERGSDPVHFTVIGSVAARGNNGGNITYQFNDGLAAVSGERFFYRLKMIDIDGKFSYSGIRMLSREGESINEVIVTPNPVNTGTGFALINFEKDAIAELNIVDMQGRVTVIGYQKINKGYNVVPVDLSSFTNGNYVFLVKAGGQRLVSKFVLRR